LKPVRLPFFGEMKSGAAAMFTIMQEKVTVYDCSLSKNNCKIKGSCSEYVITNETEE
jgi:hypothetical protein